MMKTTVEEIRAALVRGKDAVGRPYSEEARRAVLALVERRRREGTGLTRIAEEIGVSAGTLRKWTQQRPARTGGAVAEFCEVEIVAARTEVPALVIHGPSGLRIEGATIAQCAELFRRLA
jgi:transposase